jgi:hypothetical protein
MQFCTNCGVELHGDERFCDQCGQMAKVAVGNTRQASLGDPQATHLTLTPLDVPHSPDAVHGIREVGPPETKRERSVEQAAADIKFLNVPPRIALYAAAKSFGVLLGSWLALLIVASIGTSVSGYSLPYVPKISAALILLSFGGTVSGHGGVNFVSGAASLRFAPLFLAIGIICLLNFAHKRRSITDENRLGYALFSALGGVIAMFTFSWISKISGSFSISNFSSSGSFSSTWLVPGVVIAVVLILISTPVDKIPYFDLVRLPLQFIKTFGRRLLQIWFELAAILGIVTIAILGFASGSGAPMQSGIDVWGNFFPFVLTCVVAVIVFTLLSPNIVPLAFFALFLGISISGSSNIHTSGLITSILPSTALSKSAGSPSENFALLILGVIVMFLVATRVFKNVRSNYLWVNCAVSFGVLALIVGWFTSLTVNVRGSAGFVIGGSAIGSIGTRLVSDFLFGAVAGAVVGLGAHPKVADAVNPRFDALLAGLRNFRKSVSIKVIRYSRITGFVKRHVSNKDQPRLIVRSGRRLRFWLPALVGLLLVTTILGKVITSIPGVVKPPSSDAIALSNALRDGNAQAFNNITGDYFGVQESSSGVSVKTTELPASDSSENDYLVNWDKTGGVTMYFVLSGKYGGLLPTWLSYGLSGQMPQVALSSSSSSTNAFVKLNGLALTSAKPLTLMPGTYSLSSTSVDPRNLSASATFPNGKTTMLILQSASVSYTNSLTNRGRDLIDQQIDRSFHSYLAQQEAAGNAFGSVKWKYTPKTETSITMNNDGTSVNLATNFTYSGYETTLTFVATFDSHGSVSVPLPTAS